MAKLVGVAQITVDGDIADLQKMFVEPSAIGLGVGKALFAWAVSTAKNLGAQHMTIDADPGAVGFYKKMGAVEHGAVPSGSIPGRMLPRLQVELRCVKRSYPRRSIKMLCTARPK